MISYLLSINERVTNRNEVFVQDFKTGKQAPDHDDETREIIVVVQQDLSVVTTNANADSLRWRWL